MTQPMHIYKYIYIYTLLTLLLLRFLSLLAFFFPKSPTKRQQSTEDLCSKVYRICIGSNTAKTLGDRMMPIPIKLDSFQAKQLQHSIFGPTTKKQSWTNRIKYTNCHQLCKSRWTNLSSTSSSSSSSSSN